MVRDALQHFQWAVERFEAMSQRNPLAKAALGVLHAIYVRLKRALGISCGTARRMLASGSWSTSFPGESNSNSFAFSLLDASNSSSTTGAAFKPSPSTDSKPGLSTITPPATEDEFSPPQMTQTNGVPQQGNNTAPTSTPSNSTPNFNFNLDPDLFGNSSTSTSDGQFDWNPPSDFDWASLQPIYATSDLIYHDLMGTTPVAAPAGDSRPDSGWDYQNLCPGQIQGNGFGYGENAAGLTSAGGEGMGVGVGAAAGHTAGGGGGLPAVCRFQGDFGDDSVWSLLNQYAPY
jgi:hypothetical protein